MALQNIKSIKIFPGIGMGRVGNSPDYFIGPEAPNIVPNGGEKYHYGYKDSEGKVLRQAARYRIYGYDENGKVVAELKAGTSDNITINWDVHLTNKKAANYAFQGKFGFDPTQFRNPGIQVKKSDGTYYKPDERTKLIIDPGLKSISGISRSLGNGTSIELDGGTIFNKVDAALVPTVLVPPYNKVSGMTEVKYRSKEVSLGRLETDANGRLIIVPGEGKGESLTQPPLPIMKGPAKFRGGEANPDPVSNGNSYFNNPGWYDDTAGGSINASVNIPGVGTFQTNNDPTQRGWFGSAPPNYGPSLYNVVSLLDLQLNIFPESDPNTGDILAAITGEDAEIYVNSSPNGSDFSEFQETNGVALSGSRPSIAYFKGKKYIAITGAGGTHNYISHSDTAYVSIGTIASLGGPAIAVYNNRLYYAVTGTDGGTIYLAYSSDGVNFSDFTPIPATNSPAITTTLSPSLAAYNGALYLAITTRTGIPYLGTFTFEQPAGTEPSVSIEFKTISANFKGLPIAGSIAAFDDQFFYALIDENQELCLARWNNTANGQQDFENNFTIQTISGQQSKYPPALAAFNGKLYYGITSDNGEVLIAKAEAAAGDLTFGSFTQIQQGTLATAGISLADAETISFYRDIHPILKTVTNYAWVNQPAFNGHGPGTRGDFLQPTYIEHLASPEPFPTVNPLISPSGQINRARSFVFGFIRPGETITDAPPPPMALPNTDYNKVGGVQRGSLMPHLYGEGGSDTENHFNGTNFPNQWLSLTRHQLSKFQKWINGDFETGTIPTPVELDDLPLEEQPMAMNFAALQPTVGGGFHPGIELTYNMKYAGYFAAAFRFADEITYKGAAVGAITPGSVAAYMSIPWHGDFWSCNISWWAAMRPDIVLQDRSPANPAPGDPPLYVPIDWFRGEAVGIPPNADNLDAYLTLPNEINKTAENPYGTTGYVDMAKYWCKFGFVVPKVENGSAATDDGETVLEETERDPCLDDNTNPCSTCD